MPPVNRTRAKRRRSVRATSSEGWDESGGLNLESSSRERRKSLSFAQRRHRSFHWW